MLPLHFAFLYKVDIIYNFIGFHTHGNGNGLHKEIMVLFGHGAMKILMKLKCPNLPMDV